MLISLVSASGSPGVSTTALGLALAWPRDVILLEADTTGYSPTLAGYFGGTVVPRSTLLDLHPGADFEEQLMNSSVPLVETQDPTRRLVPAISNPLQGRALSSRWEALASGLYDLERAGMDVIADLGRINAPFFATPLLRLADVSALLLRPTIPATLAASSTISHRGLNADDGLSAPAFHLLTVAAPGTYSAGEVSRALRQGVIGTIPWAEKHAAVLAHGAPRPRRFESSSYMRSLSGLGRAFLEAGSRRREAIGHLRRGGAR